MKPGLLLLAIISVALSFNCCMSNITSVFKKCPKKMREWYVTIVPALFSAVPLGALFAEFRWVPIATWGWGTLIYNLIIVFGFLLALYLLYHFGKWLIKFFTPKEVFYYNLNFLGGLIVAIFVSVLVLVHRYRFWTYLSVALLTLVFFVAGYFICKHMKRK